MLLSPDTVLPRVRRKIGRLAASGEQKAIETPLTFMEFVSKVKPKYQWYEHCVRLAGLLQQVADGEIKRLMVFEPPRHGKSEMASKLFPAYYLYCHPDRWVGVNSYAADLAYTFSRAARDAYRTIGGEVRDDSASVKQWDTPSGGGLWAAGVGGGITGKGFSLGLIDDPLKNQEEAFSETVRQKQQEWYESTFYTRAESEAAIVVIQTRWHESDLSGWLLKQESESDEPENWHIVSLAAIAEPLPTFPTTCTVEPDWRKEGDALCPERFSVDRLRKIKSKVGSYFWAALYAQRPAPIGGGMIKLAWFNRYSEPPTRSLFTRVLISADTALTAKESSCPWAIGCFGEYRGMWYWLDLIVRKMETPDGKRALVSFCEKWSPNVVIIENKSSGAVLIQELAADPKFRFSLYPENPTADKVTRMMGELPAIEAGKVWLPNVAGWLPELESAFESYPNGLTMDEADCLSQLLKYVREHPMMALPPIVGKALKKPGG